jgi:hypothetical protein
LRPIAKPSNAIRAMRAMRTGATRSASGSAPRSMAPTCASAQRNRPMSYSSSGPRVESASMKQLAKPLSSRGMSHHSACSTSRTRARGSGVASASARSRSILARNQAS